jgi:O-acetyl-ADP-ribose deacetylase (regulator of RNase III)
MTSKAFYKSSVVPQLVHRVSSASGGRALEIWTTTCIVTNFGKTAKTACSVLVNPSNPELSGVKNFPYFPRGGPVPKGKPSTMHTDWQPLAYVSNWGGMEVGNGMLYPISVVDGFVHQLGGWKLEAECAWKRMTASGEACPIGTAVQTSAGGDRLSEEYDSIIHTTPPFFLHDKDPETKLRSCYESALGIAFRRSDGPLRVALPLLGSGARGFPRDVAINVASKACLDWCSSVDENAGERKGEQVVVFGLLESELAEKFAERIEGQSTVS